MLNWVERENIFITSGTGFRKKDTRSTRKHNYAIAAICLVIDANKYEAIFSSFCSTKQ